MKRILSTLILLYAGIVSYSQGIPVEYTINGHIDGLSSGKIYFTGMFPLKLRDSAEIRYGHFRFTGTLPEPSRVMLYFIHEPTGSIRDNQYTFTFFLDKGKHSISLHKDDLSKGQVKGSQAAHDYELYVTIENSILNLFSSIKLLNKDTSTFERTEHSKAQAESLMAAKIAFIKSHPSSIVAAWIAYHYSMYEMYNTLSHSLHTLSYVEEMKATMDKQKMHPVGAMAPNFTQNDTLGRVVSLIDFRGKYVLLDFWASWCGPCRKENPNVVKAFTQYRDKDFTVLGVALERPEGSRQAWLKAIHDDGLTWTQVSDFKYWDNAVAQLYGVTGVPQNWLIGPDGKILAKNLYGDELQKTLENILK